MKKKIIKNFNINTCRINIYLQIQVEFLKQSKSVNNKCTRLKGFASPERVKKVENIDPGKSYVEAVPTKASLRNGTNRCLTPKGIYSVKL